MKGNAVNPEKRARQLKVAGFFGKAAGWLWGLAFLAFASVSSATSQLGAFMVGVAGIAFIPLTWSLTSKALGRRLSPFMFVVLGIGAFLIGKNLLGEGDATLASQNGFASAKDYKAAKFLKLDAKGYAAHVQAQNVACRSDLKCWSEKHEQSAYAVCRTAIQRLAKYDYEWTGGMTMPLFYKMKWDDQKKGTVVYMGDQIKLQNGFGVFAQHRYACHFDPSTGMATNAQIEPGRL